MKSRNGVSRTFRFTIRDKDTNVETWHEFSFKHKKLSYKKQEKWLVDTDISGALKDQFCWIRHSFTIDWSDVFEGEDSDKFVIVEQAEKDGHLIFLTPHIDVPSLEYNVVTLKDDDGKREVEFSQIINNRNSPGNEGTIVTYVTPEPDYVWKTVDPSNQQGVATIGCEEFS